MTRKNRNVKHRGQCRVSPCRGKRNIYKTFFTSGDLMVINGRVKNEKGFFARVEEV